MQRISQSLTGNHALSWLLKMPSIKKKMPSLSTNQRSVILPFIDNNNNNNENDNDSDNENDNNIINLFFLLVDVHRTN